MEMDTIIHGNFVTDATQWSDTDGDGYPSGRQKTIQLNGLMKMETDLVITNLEQMEIQILK